MRRLSEYPVSNANEIAIASVVNDFELQISRKERLAGVREVVYQRSLPLATARLRIVQSMAGGYAGILGAGHMVIDHALSPASVELLVQQQP